MHFKDYDIKDWVKFRVENQIQLNGFKIVLLEIDRTVMPSEEGRKNLLALDYNDKIKWIADLPKSYSMFGSYQEIRLENNELTAVCGSTHCKIDIQTGKILSEKFIKQ